MAKRGLLSNEVANDIKRYIIDNDLQKGNKIPNETELSELLEVSRITVREAIKILSASGVVEIKRGVGTFICDKPGIVSDPLGLAFLSPDMVKLQIHEVRLLIEPPIIEQVARVIKDDETAELEMLHSEILEQIHEFKQGNITRAAASKRYADYEIAFHTRIARCSGNDILERIMYIIMEAYIERYWEKHYVPTGSRYGTFHKSLIQALKEKNPDKAGKLMRKHIEEASAWKENYQKQVQ